MSSLLSGKSYSLGRWFGFEVRIHYSWFLIFALVLGTFSFAEFPRILRGYGQLVYLTMGVVGTLLFFLSLLLHELSHSAMARRRGIEVEGITLFVFGGVAQTSMEAETPADEFLLTVVGPLCSVALGAAFYGVYLGAVSWGLAPPVREVAWYLAWINLALAVFNMIPGFPLDGGRIFRSTVWYLTGNLEKATRWATRGGQAVGYLLMAFGAWRLFNGFLIDGLWSGFIGWFLSSVAAASYEQYMLKAQLSGLRVSRVLEPGGAAIPADMDLGTAAEEYFLRRTAGAYPVVRDGELVGLIGLEELSEVPPGERSGRSVGEVALPAEEVPTVDPDAGLDEVLTLLRGSGPDRVLVVRNDTFLGVVTSEELGRWIRRARRLGLGSGRDGGEDRAPVGEGRSPGREPRVERGGDARIDGGEAPS